MSFRIYRDSASGNEINRSITELKAGFMLEKYVSLSEIEFMHGFVLGVHVCCIDKNKATLTEPEAGCKSEIVIR